VTVAASSQTKAEHLHCCVCLFFTLFCSGYTILNPIICAKIIDKTARAP